MAKRKWVSSSKCRLFNAKSESTSHVLFDCPALAEVRERGKGGGGGGGLDLETALWGSARDTAGGGVTGSEFSAYGTRVKHQGFLPTKGPQLPARIGHKLRGPCQVSLVWRELYQLITVAIS